MGKIELILFVGTLLAGWLARHALAVAQQKLLKYKLDSVVKERDSLLKLVEKLKKEMEGLDEEIEKMEDSLPSNLSTVRLLLSDIPHFANSPDRSASSTEKKERELESRRKGKHSTD